VLIKALKYFRFFILHSYVTVYVPNAAINSILVQPDNDGKRGTWIAKMLEFNLEIKPTKLIKVLGMDRLMTESNLDVIGINSIFELSDLPGE